jgi:hypothetical protein
VLHKSLVRLGRTTQTTDTSANGAYTQMTAEILAKAGYPQQQITCLSNAIDTGAFKRDLAVVADADVYTLEKMVAQFADGIARCLGR